MILVGFELQSSCAQEHLSYQLTSKAQRPLFQTLLSNATFLGKVISFKFILLVKYKVGLIELWRDVDLLSLQYEFMYLIVIPNTICILLPLICT